MQRYNPMTKCLETVKTNDYLGTLPIDKKKPPKFKDIEEIYKKCKAEGRSFKNNERDWFKKALEYADKKAYKPEERRKLNDWYKQIVRQNFKDHKTVDRIPVKKVLKALKSKLNVYYIIEDTDGRYWVTTKKDGSGGGTLEFSMSNAIKTAQNYIKMDELQAKYGKEEGYKKWMRGEDDKKTFELYKNTILSESKKRAEQFVREAEQDFDLTDKEVDELWKIFRNHF